jgi:hypothetical protein
MNAGKKGEDSNRSGLTRSRLFGAFGHVHNPFSTNSRRTHGVEAYRKDESSGALGVMDFETEMAKIEAGIMAQNLIARIQKS